MACLILTLLFSVGFLPGFALHSGWPQLRVDDLLAFLLLVTLLSGRSGDLIISRPLACYSGVVLIFVLWILATIMANGRYLLIGDYFEIYKSIKFLIFFWSVYIYARYQTIDPTSMWLILTAIFLGLLIFNLFGYFNLFNFNYRLMPFYASGERISGFGLDSLGNPSVKRMLGTMGNPNDNAILFSLFASYFLVSIRIKRWLSLGLLAISVMLILLTGSRTVLIGVFVSFALYGLMEKFSLKKGLLFAASVIAVIFLVYLLDLKYISILWQLDIRENPSWVARLEVWDRLGEMITRSPLWGHGPNKDYFYANSLYSESEYVLMTWRYGYIGLFLYSLWLFLPAMMSLLVRQGGFVKLLFIFSVILAVSAITNNPLSEPRIMAVFAMLCGLFFFQMAKGTTAS